jgi:hypothetical protein
MVAVKKAETFMKEGIKNFYYQVTIFCVPCLLSLILKNGNGRYLILFGPLGLALFHFRGKVWNKHWYSRKECTIWGVGWLIVAIIFLVKLFWF